jgi:hypothetical protein
MPTIPSIETSEALPGLEREFYARAKDLVNGLALLGAQLKAGKIDDAATTLKVLQEDKDAPKYLYALDFNLHSQRKEWRKAWQAWVEFEERPN